MGGGAGSISAATRSRQRCPALRRHARAAAGDRRRSRGRGDAGLPGFYGTERRSSCCASRQATPSRLRIRAWDATTRPRDAGTRPFGDPFTGRDDRAGTEASAMPDTPVRGWCSERTTTEGADQMPQFDARQAGQGVRAAILRHVQAGIKLIGPSRGGERLRIRCGLAPGTPLAACRRGSSRQRTSARLLVRDPILSRNDGAVQIGGSWARCTTARTRHCVGSTAPLRFGSTTRRSRRVTPTREPRPVGCVRCGCCAAGTRPVRHSKSWTATPTRYTWSWRVGSSALGQPDDPAFLSVECGSASRNDDAAIAAFATAIRLDAECAEALADHATALRMAGKRADAEAALDEVPESGPRADRKSHVRRRTQRL